MKSVLKRVLMSVLVLAMSISCLGVAEVTAEAATTMKVESFEGKVALKNAKGKAKTIKSGTNLLNGDKLTTQRKSTANILLDETKAALVEESSTVSVNQSGNDLVLKVGKGSVFFDVSKKLEDDETFKIKTSNMVCGIRGTIGEVKVVKNKKKNKFSIYLLEGTVNVSYKVNKKKRTTKTVEAGKKLTITTDNKTGKSSAKVADVKSSDIKIAVGTLLQENESTYNRVQEACPNIDWSQTVADAVAGKNEEIVLDGTYKLRKSYYDIPASNISLKNNKLVVTCSLVGSGETLPYNTYEIDIAKNATGVWHRSYAMHYSTTKMTAKKLIKDISGWHPSYTFQCEIEVKNNVLTSIKADTN